ncbi:uncharacterized protein UMAG_01361 [Mycosarcoma maydis]|uniref:Uncharacterized protein n=1 Tax=Mycosarcoma maydis TaxID=5270 RepID=A0A0D1CEI0_MYCMD|nr:uncharacterized protein UMAG_01361 [Ustilago maydis 521]KIS71467.1 hypothetical protein UMAG_01361 [Ustilago maydis 521]|eukprot:XP_011387253.1 hypothetical protein UMAG_01361 [Ustilago maydis 521]
MAAARRIESRADDDARFTMAAPTHCQSPASDAGKACACASDSVYALCVTGTNHESLYPNLKLAEWRRTDSHNYARVAEERSVTIAKCLAVQLDRNATVALVAADVALRSAAKATVTCDRMRGSRQQALEQGTLTSIFPTRLVCCRSANRESLLHIQLWSIRALSHPAAFTQLGLSSRLNRRSSNPASRRVASTPVTEHGSRSHEPRAKERHLAELLAKALMSFAPHQRDFLGRDSRFTIHDPRSTIHDPRSTVRSSDAALDSTSHAETFVHQTVSISNCDL